MKNKFLYLLSALLILATWSCKKDEKQVIYNGGTAPVLSANSTSIPLSYATKDNEAVTLSWTNPAYMFNTGVSSQNVSYQLELDTTGANFSNPNKKVISISKDLAYTFTQDELNDYLLNTLVLVPGMAHNIEFRVKSFLPNNNAQLTSNVLKFTVTPYAIPPKVVPPASGTLFIVGDATPGGWNNPVPVPSQQLTKLSPTLYKITLPLTGGKSYLFLPVNGDWSAKFGGMGANNTNNPFGDDFKPGGGDLLAPPANGTYTITVDFQRGKFTVQ
jgi:starch-binding outer membrane protein SusE/F